MITNISKTLRVFRDDVFPFLGGGNKGRKINYIAKEVEKQGCNAVVTTGGTQSNHCRALAVVSAQKKWKCTLVLHGNKEEFYKSGGNALLMRLSGAEIVFVESSDIGRVMDMSMDQYKNKGLNPYYVWGGGHTMDGGLAYINAIKELKEYCDINNWYPDYIFLPSGTGSTQAGIMAGLDKYNIKTKVIGISVARQKMQAEKIVFDFYRELCYKYDIIPEQGNAVVSDDYLFGGYEIFNSELKELSDNSLKKHGFLLDTTYSGKAFFGMNDIIKKKNINGNVLFWHTGGVLNFLS